MPRRSHRPVRSPKSVRPSRTSDLADRAVGRQTAQSTRDGDFLVRTVPGAAAVKSYRCPGCQRIIPPGTAHLVVWPDCTGAVSDGVANRRHWHTPCWQRRAAGGGPGRLGW